MCKISDFTGGLCHTTSILILTIIAVERYVALVHTFRSRQLITVRRLGVSNFFIQV